MLLGRAMYILLAGSFLLNTEKAGAEYPYETTEDKILDYMKITLVEDGGLEKDHFLICLNNASSPGYAHATDEDGFKLTTGTKLAVGTICDDDFFGKDTRPYDGYSARFELRVDFMKSGQYRFEMAQRTTSSSSANIARSARLIDKKNPDRNINLFTETYTFTVTDIKEDASRFSIIVYAAEASIRSGNWTKDPSIWVSKVAPAETDHVVIAEGTEITIDKGENMKIESLSNYGLLINEGTLEVANGVNLLSK